MLNANPKASSCDSLSVTISKNDSIEIGFYNLRFNAFTTGEGLKIIKYTWDFGDSQTSTTYNPSITHSYSSSGSYHIKLSIVDTNENCTATDSIDITLEKTNYAPNVFSPNGDGINDLFIIEGNGIDIMNFSLYNPYGNIVYQRSGANIIWDGKNSFGHEVSIGTYYYVLITKNGNKTGTIHLFR